MTIPQHLPATPHRCWCGTTYGPGASERQRHQTLHGHRPEPPRPRPEPDAGGQVTTECHRGLHIQCALDGQPGGVLVGYGLTAECGCDCHRPKPAARDTGQSYRCHHGSHGRCTGIRYSPTGHGIEACTCTCHQRKAEVD